MTVVNPQPLTFEVGNWFTPQTVTVAAAEDDADGLDETATVTHTVAGYYLNTTPGIPVSVSVTDNDFLLRQRFPTGHIRPVRKFL